jgi:RNA polymerase sigma factor (sigma-70 family)
VRRLADESLLTGLGLSDPEAEVAFVRRFQPRVFGFALSVLGDAHAAEDVAQEALLRAWRHADAYDPRRGSVATWLLTITRNLSVDALRLRRAHAVDPSEIPAIDPAGSRTESGDDAPLDALAIRAALATLPAEQQRAVLLASFFGYTAREISEMDAIPLGTAKTRIRSGLLKLRTALEPGGRTEERGSLR